jgi:hypothetical protein
MRVATEERTRKKSDARENRSAGSGEALVNAADADMVTLSS